MSKDEMLNKVNEKMKEENYEHVQSWIESAMFQRMHHIYVGKEQFSSTSKRYILDSVLPLLEKDGFHYKDVENDGTIWEIYW